jgi:hypothetical protein
MEKFLREQKTTFEECFSQFVGGERVIKVQVITLEKENFIEHQRVRGKLMLLYSIKNLKTFAFAVRMVHTFQFLRLLRYLEDINNRDLDKKQCCEEFPNFEVTYLPDNLLELCYKTEGLPEIKWQHAACEIVALADLIDYIAYNIH